MLTKLLKYDFRALTRIMLPLQGGVLLAAVVGSFSIRIAVDSIARSFDSYFSTSSISLPLEQVIYTTTIMLGIFLFVAIAASFWITLFLTARHYYQSFLRDEGYLTFTLPVSTSQNLCSKIIAGSAWLLVNTLIICFALLLLFSVGLAEGGRDIFTSTFAYIAETMSNVPGFILLLELIILGLLLVVHAIMQVYVSLNIGAVLAKTHKVLAGIGIYVGINMIMQTFMSIITFGLSFGLDSTISSSSQYDWFYGMQTLVLPSLIIHAGLIVLYFFISKNLLTNKLNLD